MSHFSVLAIYCMHEYLIIFYKRIEQKESHRKIFVCHKCYKIYLHLYIVSSRFVCDSYTHLVYYCMKSRKFCAFFVNGKFFYIILVFYLDRHTHKFLTRAILYPRYSFVFFSVLFDGFIGLFIPFFRYIVPFRFYDVYLW